MTLAEAMRRANAACAQSDWAEAERLCRAILSARADDLEALNLLGIIGAQTGRLDLAVDKGQRSLHGR